MGLPVASIGVSVEKRDKKGKKGKQKNINIMENEKISNYDLLKKLGFPKDFIDENKKLGLKESKLKERGSMQEYLVAF